MSAMLFLSTPYCRRRILLEIKRIHWDLRVYIFGSWPDFGERIMGEGRTEFYFYGGNIAYALLLYYRLLNFFLPRQHPFESDPYPQRVWRKSIIFFRIKFDSQNIWVYHGSVTLSNRIRPKTHWRRGVSCFRISDNVRREIRTASTVNTIWSFFFFDRI